MSRKPIAFRSTVRGGVEDFLEESGLTEKILITGIFSLVDKVRGYKEEMAYARWIRASWYFGLRPSELDRCIQPFGE